MEVNNTQSTQTPGDCLCRHRRRVMLAKYLNAPGEKGGWSTGVILAGLLGPLQWILPGLGAGEQAPVLRDQAEAVNNLRTLTLQLKTNDIMNFYLIKTHNGVRFHIIKEKSRKSNTFSVQE